MRFGEGAGAADGSVAAGRGVGGGAEHGIVGRVETFDAELGIGGWAFDPLDRGAGLDVELLAGDLPLAVVGTDRYRADLGSADDPTFNPGFVIPGAALRAAALNPAADPDDALGVRVGGRVRLDGIPLPTLRALRDAVEAEGLPARDTFGLDLRRALATLTEDAVLLRRRPIRPVAANLRGYIEAVAVIDRHLTAFSGWCHRGMEAEQGAVLLDGEKHSAAFSIATFERADLPDHAQAFVGVLHTAWRPRPRGSEPFLFFGANGEFHLRSASTLRPGPIAAMEGAIAHVPPGDQHRLMDLRHLLLTNEGWTPRGDKGAGLGVALSLDRVLLVPGFGALVEGWLLGGARQLAGMSLRLGSKVLHLDPSTLRRVSREDLAKGLPMFRDGVHAAGFAGFFVGALDAADMLDPMLKVGFTDGVGVSIEVNAALLRHFDATYDADALQRGFPSLALEPLFPALAAARSAFIRRQILGSAQPVIRAVADRVLVLVLPPSESDLRLVLDGVVRHLGMLPEGVALALVGDSRQNREAILRGIAAARARMRGRAVSLTLVGVVDHALLALPTILGTHRARRFVFAGADVWLTREGWSRAAAFLAAPEAAGDAANDAGARATPLPVSTRVGGGAERDDALFGWSRAAVTAWLEGRPVPFDEAAGYRGLPCGPLATGGARGDAEGSAGGGHGEAVAAMRLRQSGRSVYKAGLDAELFPSEMFDA